MLRAYLTEQKRCYNHPHRFVRTACARCKAAYCDECLTTRTDGVFGRLVARDEKHPPPLFCARCVDELEVIAHEEALRRRPLWQRMIPSREAVRRTAIYLAVIAVVLVPLSLAVRNMAETTLTPEELARIKIGLLGNVQQVEGTNLLSQVYGGTFIRASAPSAPGRDPSRLIDTWATVEVPGWRSQSATFPQELVFAFPARVRVNRVALVPHPSEPEATWVKDFEVLVSTDSADSGFTSIVSGTLTPEQGRAAIVPQQPGAALPRFDFPEANVRFIMLRVLSNHGSEEYVSLAEFEVLSRR